MPRSHRIIRFGIRTSEIFFNLAMRVSWSSLEFLSKALVHLDLPEFYDSIQKRDFPAVRRMVGRLAKTGYNPRQVYFTAARGVPGLTPRAWDDLLEEAFKVQPEEFDSR